MPGATHAMGGLACRARLMAFAQLLAGAGCNLEPDVASCRTQCRDHGKCRDAPGAVEGTECSPTANCLTRDGVLGALDCRVSEVCKAGGDCFAVDGACQAKLGAEGEAFCRMSTGCWILGACVPVEETEPCRTGSNRTVRRTDCLIRREDDCRRSRRCAEEGLCWLGPERGCVAKSAEDCKATRLCIESGHGCLLHAGRCVSTKP